MIKYFCDRCGAELDIDDFTSIKPGVTENAQKIDLCLMCAVELDGVIQSFVNSTGCCDCEFAEKGSDEYPCSECAKNHLNYFKWKEN